MTLRTDPEFEAALTFLAQRDGDSKQEVVRRAVMERAEREGHRDRVSTLSKKVASDWSETLDRLGTV